MRTDRRGFLKIAGIAALGLGIKPGMDALLGHDLVEASPEMLAQGAGEGIRWAMVVDLPKCWATPGCTECIAACDEAHNIPHFDDAKKEIKWTWEEPYGKVFPEQDPRLNSSNLGNKLALLLCNHCDNPPCVRVCPTKATWQRPDGIVMMDFHRCIGCRYCIVACPYGSRSFNFVDPRTALDMNKVNPDYPTRTRGVVEKCTLCQERIDVGKIPACVEACPQHALVFGDMNDPNSQVRKIVESRTTLVRKPELGTRPQVHYIVS